MSGSRFTIIEAPSSLGLFPGGVEMLPDALLGAGLAEGLGARRGPRLEDLPYTSVADRETGIRNASGIARYAARLADLITAARQNGDIPLVLGGDCSILLGALVALRRAGRSGLLFLDGHADFYQPAADPRGEAASMELALATARGPAILADLEGRGPLVRDEDVVVFGRRDAADAEANGSQRIEDSGILVLELAEIRDHGLDATLAIAFARVARPGLAGFWLHLDADVLDDAVMPAVDYRAPGGLSWDELESILRASMEMGRTVGIDVTIFNPRLDRDGSIARALSDSLVRGLAPS